MALKTHHIDLASKEIAQALSVSQSIKEGIHGHQNDIYLLKSLVNAFELLVRALVYLNEDLEGKETTRRDVKPFSDPIGIRTRDRYRARRESRPRREVGGSSGSSDIGTRDRPRARRDSRSSLEFNASSESSDMRRRHRLRTRRRTRYRREADASSSSIDLGMRYLRPHRRSRSGRKVDASSESSDVTTRDLSSRREFRSSREVDASSSSSDIGTGDRRSRGVDASGESSDTTTRDLGSRSEFRSGCEADASSESRDMGTRDLTPSRMSQPSPASPTDTGAEPRGSASEAYIPPPGPHQAPYFRPCPHNPPCVPRASFLPPGPSPSVLPPLDPFRHPPFRSHSPYIPPQGPRPHRNWGNSYPRRHSGAGRYRDTQSYEILYPKTYDYVGETASGRL